MRVVYELTFQRQCPLDDSKDSYHLTIEANHIITAEDILHVITHDLPEKAFQEDLTRIIARKLGTECVTTVGYHSGVKTTCTV